MSLREPDAREAKRIIGTFETVETGLSVRVVADRRIGVLTARQREADSVAGADARRDGADEHGDSAAAALRVVLFSPDLARLPRSLWDAADHAGLAIGSLEDAGLAFDLQGAVLLARHTRRSVVRVNEKATRLWLYGRDILAGSVTDHDGALGPGDTCIIVGPRWEGLGLGTVMGSFKGDGVVVRPVHDLGAYLRDQGGTDRRRRGGRDTRDTRRA